MIHQFPPHCQPLPLNITHSPPTPSNSQQLLIEQLRRQNQMLKQQLQAMMRMQSQCPPLPMQRGNFFLPSQAQNHEDEAEVAYRNKMSKLKTKKSNRKSHDQSATAPSSPKGSFVTYEQSSTRREPVPMLLMADPRCKMMVISKDKDGKFFRDRSQEEKMMTTARKGNPSQDKKIMQSPPVKCIIQGNKENNLAKFTKINGHQRVGSAHPVKNIEQTERIYKPTPAPTLANIPNKAEIVLSPRYNRNSQFNQATDRRPIYHPFPPQIQRENTEMRVPRGNVYFEKAEEKNRQAQHKDSLADFTSEGDSRLSIEMDLRKARSNRRLNYDIYLQDEHNRP